jgi:hypothetical protein
MHQTISINFYSAVFGPTKIEDSTINKWLSFYQQSPPKCNISTASNITSAIKLSRLNTARPRWNSHSSRPDIRIKFKPTIAHKIVNKLEDTRILPPNFNDANFYTPPKVEGTTDIAETRSISVPNTVNRIIAKATIIALTPILQQFLRPKQHTFLLGRSINNVLNNLNEFFCLLFKQITLCSIVGLQKSL